jgi:hypothetical protein
MQPTRPTERLLPVDWKDSAWVPRVTVRSGLAAIPVREYCERRESSGGEAVAVKVRPALPRLRFSPLTVFGPQHPKSGPSLRITYRSSRANSQ